MAEELIGVCLRYCVTDESGNVTTDDRWVKMNKVGAVTWSDQNYVPDRDVASAKKEKFLEFDKTEPKCKSAGMPAVPGEPLCWYDGSEWRCD